MPLSHANHLSPEAGSKKVNASGNARARNDTIKKAVAGAETVVAAEDSSGNAISNVSPLSMSERQAAKDNLK